RSRNAALPLRESAGRAQAAALFLHEVGCNRTAGGSRGLVCVAAVLANGAAAKFARLRTVQDRRKLGDGHLAISEPTTTASGSVVQPKSSAATHITNCSGG